MHRVAKSGFALLEAVVATAIVGTVAVGVLSAASTEARVAERARHAVEAASLAQQRLAVLEVLNRNELIDLRDSLASGNFSDPFAAYSWRSAANPTDHATDELMDVSVDVAWKDGSYHLAERLYRPRIEAISR